MTTQLERRRAPRRRLSQLTTRDKGVLGVMIGLPTLIQAVLVWLPLIASIILSFMKWDGLSLGGFHFNGLTNYKFALEQSPQFWPAVLHNVIWLLFLAVIGTPLGLLLAVLLDQNIRGSRIYQSIFFLPVMLSLALIGIIWELMYSQDNGLINNVLGTAGTSRAIDWYGNSNVNLWAAMVAATWRHTGYIMILYLAGLKGVDPSLREAASLDGANARQTFFRVVFPAMAPTNVIIVVITIIESLRAFDIVYVINGGTNGLELLSVLVVKYLVGETQVIGIGSAFAVVLLVISLVPIVFYLARTFRKAER
ncbi:carbohydrate ABC transporter permease [Curtobacterium sp. Leaf261]|uniref:carbohydrate ABC transporter permease n=1 Tax=Curtobacterium sp. Leaf261 TaxID=1736311 RepID=UPI0006F5FBF7|nr:sugar ABC transporter permease [Curtobacterium sp. Leaf261]KQO63016.1 ABC transporter permease [Curtobacterium sp. Leaf261]